MPITSPIWSISRVVKRAVCFLNEFSLGVSDNSVDSTSLKEISAKITTGFNRKPSFIECDNYMPEVKEEQPLGTPVITVRI